MAVVIGVFLIFLFKNLLYILISYYQSMISYDIGAELSKKQFVAYYEKDFSFFQDHNSSILYRNIASIPPLFVVNIFLPILMIFSEGFIFISIITAIAIYSFNVFVLLLLILGSTFLLIYRSTKNKIQLLGEQINALNPEATRHLFQGIYGYTDVKLLNKELHFVSNYIRVVKKVNRMRAWEYTLNLMPTRIIEVVAVLGIMILMTYTLYFSSNPAALVTLLTVFALASYRIMPSMNRILLAFLNLKHYQYVHEILQPIKDFNTKKFMEQQKEIVKMTFNDSIELKNLSFIYPDRDSFAITDINMKIDKGQKIGFFGKSGFGKTTLVNIIMRFLKEQKGEITVDGVKLTDDNLREWRKLVGYVPQNIFILDESMAENVAFGQLKEDIDINRVEQVIEMASLKEFVAGLPDGLDTKIGEHGSRISGGQRQRIAIARALYYESEIIIFDEATSQLDPETENEILDAIQNLTGFDITVLIIAHRITTLKNCNKIYELKNGRIVGEHLFEDLVKREPIKK